MSVLPFYRIKPSFLNSVLYCQTSTRAGLAYTILTSKLGYTNVKVYDGAYSEWAVKGSSLEK